MHKKFFLTLFLLISTMSVQAASVYANNYILIHEIVSYSKEDAASPAWAGTVELRFDADILWNTSTVCEKRNVVIRKEDAHLISAALTAEAAHRAVRIYADDAARVTGNYCYVRALRY